MFENLKAAASARLTLANSKGPSGLDKDQTWSSDIRFYGAKVGSVTGKAGFTGITVKLNEELQDQIIEKLKAAGFKIDATHLPPGYDTGSSAGFMGAAIAQIADEIDLAKELRISARTQTLVMLRSSPGKATVFAERYSAVVKQKLREQYGDDLVEIINESLTGLPPL